MLLNNILLPAYKVKYYYNKDNLQVMFIKLFIVFFFLRAPSKHFKTYKLNYIHVYTTSL